MKDQERILLYVFKMSGELDRKVTSRLANGILESGNLLTLLVETGSDFTFYESEDWASHPNLIILNVDEEVRKASPFWEKRWDDRLFTRVQPGKTIDDAKRYSGFFARLFEETNFSASFFWCRGFAFRSLGASVFEYVRDQTGQSFRFHLIGLPPLKGGMVIFDDIFHQCRAVEHDYAQMLTGKGIRDEAAEELKNYLAYKKGNFNKIFDQPVSLKIRLQRLIGRSHLKSRIRDLMNPKNRLLLPLRKSFSDKPFVLLLLNKPDNWFTHFAMPLLNQDFVIQHLIHALPKGYHLVIKDHPLAGYPNPERRRIYQHCNESKNVHYVRDEHSTDKLISQSEVVTYVASTAGLDGIFQMKPCVQIGYRSLFTQERSPAIRARTLNEISPAISQAIASKPDRSKVYAYYEAWKKNLIPFAKDGDDPGLVPDIDFIDRLVPRALEKAKSQRPRQEKTPATEAPNPFSQPQA